MKGIKMFVENIVQKYWLSSDGKKIHRTDYKGENIKVDGVKYPNYEIRGVYKVDIDTTRVLMFNTKTRQYHWYLVA
tara:strand:+ start:165 stop:392 length:228 start_codon:yes stop_codon:yes gene_type:complete